MPIELYDMYMRYCRRGGVKKKKRKRERAVVCLTVHWPYNSLNVVMSSKWDLFPHKTEPCISLLRE